MKNDFTSINHFIRHHSNIIEKKDPTCSIKLSDNSTLKKGPFENKIKIEQSLSEIRLEELGSYNDPNITYLSILKIREKPNVNNITNDNEILPTNLSTNEQIISQRDKIETINIQIKDSNLINFKIDDKINTSKTCKIINNMSQSQFSKASFINCEEKFKNLVKKSRKSNNTSRSQNSSYIDNVFIN